MPESHAVSAGCACQWCAKFLAGFAELAPFSPELAEAIGRVYVPGPRQEPPDA